MSSFIRMKEEMEVVFILSVIFNVFWTGTHAVLIDVSSPVKIYQEDVVITCRTAQGEILDYVNNIQIYRNNTDGYSLQVTVTYDRTSASSKINWQNQGLSMRAVAEGDVHNSNPSLKFLRLRIMRNMTRCYDEGTYTCSLHGVTSGGLQYDDEASSDVEIRSDPDRMDDIVVASPNNQYLYPDQGFGRFPVGHNVRMTCQGTVGKPPTEFRWCIKMENDIDFMILNDAGSVVSNSNVTAVFECNFQRSCTLNYTVSTLDTRTVLLCEPASVLYCGRNPLNKTFTVEVLRITPYPTDSANLIYKPSNILNFIILILVIVACIMKN